MPTTLSTIFGALIVIASFIGLSGLIRTRFDVDCCVAPLIAASGIIVALTFGAMLNILALTCDAIYILGIAALVYVYLIKGKPAPGILLLGMLTFIIFLTWRFHNCYLRHYDDFSHWGTLARFMLLKNRLPTENDQVLTHQSYPPGSACFIYFFSKFSGYRETWCLVAQNFLYGVALLPILSWVRNRKKIYFLPVAFLMIASFLFYPWHDVDLLTDDLQSFFGIGIASVILFYRKTPKKSLLCALPAMTAVALFKNSGIFFSAVSACLLFFVLKHRHGGKRQWSFAIAGLLIPAISYILWSVHVRLCFPSGNMGNHAFSLTSYAQNIASKGTKGILTTAASMLYSLLDLKGWHMVTVLVLLSAMLLTLLSSRKFPIRVRKNICGVLAFSLCVYVLWLILTFGMYVFSMSGQGALEASSFTRYNSTGYNYAAGIACLMCLYTLQRQENTLPSFMLLIAGGSSTLLLAGTLLLALIPGNQTPIDKYIAREQNETYVHSCLADAQQYLDIPYGEHCLIFYLHDENYNFRTSAYTKNNIRYMFGTSDQTIVTAHRLAPDQLEAGIHTQSDIGIQQYISDNISDCAAVIMLDESPAFEAVLEPVLSESGPDIPVCREYERIPLT